MKLQEVPRFIPIKINGRTTFHQPIEWDNRPSEGFPRGRYSYDEAGYTYFDANGNEIIFAWGVK